MKENTIINSRQQSRTAAEAFALQLAFGITGYLFAGTEISGAMHPFGIALVAACPKNQIIATAVGNILCCLFNISSYDSVKYIAAVIMAGLIHFFLPEFDKRLSGIVSMALAGGASGLVAVTSVIVDNLGTTDIIFEFCEAALAASAAYFLNSTLKLLTGHEGFYNLTAAQRGGMLISLAISVISLAPFAMSGISLARIVGITVILLAARYGSPASAAMMGTLIGFALSVSGGRTEYVAGGFAVGGLAAGALSPVGGWCSALGFLVSYGMVALSNEISAAVIMTIYEVLIASVLFFAIPKKRARKIASVFNRKGMSLNYDDGLRHGMLMRIDFVSSALSMVSESVEKVANKLRRVNSPVIDDVMRNVRHDVCDKCKEREKCFDGKSGFSDRQFKLIEMTLKEYGKMETALLPSEFSERCVNKQEFARSTGSYYSKLMMKRSANARIDEFRSVVVSQFQNLSQMLLEMGEFSSAAMCCDERAEICTVSVMREIEIFPIDVSCVSGKFGQLLIEARVRCERDDINEKKLLNELSNALGRELSNISITEVGDDCIICISEKAELETEIYVAQHTCNNNSFCGDAYEYFYDGRGNAAMVLCDGMGNGGRAAVDGAMASGLIARLFKSGIGIESAIKLVNSAMLYKSVDESLSTVDSVKLDLFTGKCEFYKAGAAKSVVYHNGHTSKIFCDTMPIGILKDADVDRQSVVLSDGDIVVLLSDGAVDVGNEWIEEEVRKNAKQSAENIADLIAAKAKVLRAVTVDDDITVMVMKISKAS